MNFLSLSTGMWAQVSFVLSLSTRLTGGQKGRLNTVSCIACSHTVKYTDHSNAIPKMLHLTQLIHAQHNLRTHIHSY